MFTQNTWSWPETPKSARLTSESGGSSRVIALSPEKTSAETSRPLRFDKAILVPAEDVSLFAVDLPVARRDRRAAPGFAVEDQLAVPLEEPHIALGPRLRGTQFLVAAMDARKMPRETGQIVVPEQMTLPAPNADRPTWRVQHSGARVLVRASDGTGFAASLDQLGKLWAAFQAPQIETVGEALPQMFNAISPASGFGQPTKQDLAFDLRQGPFSPAPSHLRNTAIAGAGMLAAAVILNGAFLYRDIAQLDASVSAMRANVTANLATIAPGLTPSVETRAMLDRILNDAVTPENDVFLGLMDLLSRGLVTETDQITLTSINYITEARALVVRVQTDSTDTLRRLTNRLGDVGLRAETGAITAGAGGVQTELTLKEHARGPD